MSECDREASIMMRSWPPGGGGGLIRHGKIMKVTVWLCWLKEETDVFTVVKMKIMAYVVMTMGSLLSAS